MNPTSRCAHRYESGNVCMKNERSRVHRESTPFGHAFIPQEAEPRCECGKPLRDYEWKDCNACGRMHPLPQEAESEAGLKSCPFCGGPAARSFDMDSDSYTVECDAMCGACIFANTKPAADAAWNRRAEPSEPPLATVIKVIELMEHLKAALDKPDGKS